VVVGVAVTLWSVIPAAWLDGRSGLWVQTGTILIGAGGCSALFAARGWTTRAKLGWRGGRPDLNAFAGGAGVGVVMALGALLVAVAAGGARVALTGESLASYVPAAGGIGIGLAFAALAEELTFRGFPLARLAEAVGKVAASLLLAVPFALVHLGNPEVSTLGLVNIALASLVLSAAFFTPGGLPAAWGVHLGWNAGLGIGADAPVSGIALGVPMVEFETGGPVWLTGGDFGPEGGLAATVAMGGTLVWLGRRATRAEKGGAT
jgi:membrane protease YdiL (CAAX protease family)